MPTLLLLGGVVLAAAFALSRQRQRAGLPAQPPQASTAVTVPARSLRQQQAALPSLAEAEEVVRSWQVGRLRGARRRKAVVTWLLCSPCLREKQAPPPDKQCKGHMSLCSRRHCVLGPWSKLAYPMPAKDDRG